MRVFHCGGLGSAVLPAVTFAVDDGKKSVVYSPIYGQSNRLVNSYADIAYDAMERQSIFAEIILRLVLVWLVLLPRLILNITYCCTGYCKSRFVN